jgi:hypothetical protein
MKQLNLRPAFDSAVYVVFNEAGYKAITAPNSQYRWVKDGCIGSQHNCRNGNQIIAIDPTQHDNFEQICDTAAHEAYHAACDIMGHVGDDEPSEEMIARLVGQITGYVIREYLKHWKAG